MQRLPAWMPRPQKAKRKLSADKGLAAVFWDGKEILLAVFLQKRRTSNSKYYAKLLEKLIRRLGERDQTRRNKEFYFS